MPTIYVDEQVMVELKRRANGRTPNDVIRLILGLSIEKEEAKELGVYLVPHGEFRDVDNLRNWLSGELARDGEYLVASQHYWRNVIPDSICLFQKKKNIVGEGKMLGQLMPYPDNEISPLTGRRYAGIVHFDPASIKVYEKPISFIEVEKLLGKPLTWRAIQKLTLKDYEIIRNRDVSSE